MAREYRPNIREASVISRLDHAKEARKLEALQQLRLNLDLLSSRIAMKLIEERLIETNSKLDLEEQIYNCLKGLITAEDFDIQYKIANIRTLVPRPNFISLYLTAFIIEDLINHPCIVDIYGTDEEIYRCVNEQIFKVIKV